MSIAAMAATEARLAARRRRLGCFSKRHPLMIGGLWRGIDRPSLFFIRADASSGSNHIQYDPARMGCLHRAGAGRSKDAKQEMEMASLPLAGMRVLDISQVMAGPFCCMLLGDMGADVIKIEPPKTGDSTRHSMGFRLKGDDSPGFLALNRNKRSITLNLKDDADREVLYALVKTADILIENARPGVSGRLGIDYDTLAKINP